MMPALINLHRAVDSAQLADDLSAFVAQHLLDTLDRCAQALLVVSGGSTPVPFFESLSNLALPWERVVVTLADERWMSPYHEQSNEYLVRQHLLKSKAAKAIWMPFWREGLTPHEAVPAIQGELDALPWPASVVVLGMGNDGHTASLFPHDTSWLPTDAGLGRCLAVNAPKPPNVPVGRISLSPSCLLDAECVAVHVTGASKWAVLEEAAQEGEAQARPIRLVLHQQQTPCHVFYAD